MRKAKPKISNKNRKFNIIYKAIKDLKPYEKNPRKNNEAIEYVRKSIDEFGFKNPIIIDKQNVIICGHTRYEAAKQLDMKEVPCIIADDLTEDEINAFRLADNKVAEFSKWNKELLAVNLEAIQIDMSKFGFDLSSMIDNDIVGDIKFTEEMMEENNYLVLFVDKSIDWLQVESLFDIKPVKALDSKGNRQRIGTGRVIDGTDFIKKIIEVEKYDSKHNKR